jgi:hypothetical protein
MASVSFDPEDIGWANIEVNMPPDGFFRVGRNWRAKYEFKFGAMVAEGPDSNPYFVGRSNQLAEAVATAVRGQEEDTSRRAGVSLRGGIDTELDTDRLEEMGEAIIQGEGLNGALSKLTDEWGGGIGAGNELAEITGGVGWDEDFCIFKITCTVGLPLTPRMSLEGVRLQALYEATLKFGLSETGWAALLQRVATRLPATTRFAQALNAFFQPLRNRLAASLARLGIAATPRLGAFLSFVGTNANIWMWAITLGFAVRDLSVWICRRSWEAGVRRGTYVTYSNAFARTIFGHEPVFENYVPHIREVQTRAQSHARAIIQRGNRLAAQAWLMNSFGDTMVSVQNADDAQLIGTRMGMDMDRSGQRETEYLEELRRFIEAWRAAA